MTITQADLDQARSDMTTAEPGEVDFVSLGCPHLTLREIQRIAHLLEGKQVTKEFWIHHLPPRQGYGGPDGVHRHHRKSRR